MIESDVTEGATEVNDLQADVGACDVITPPPPQPHDRTYGARPAAGNNDAFLAGFRDCSREAVRYLHDHQIDASDLQRHLANVEETWLSAGESQHGDDSALGLSLLDDDNTSDEKLALSADVVGRSESDCTTELSQNAYDLLRLAQNNPRISSILNQLFTLIDADDDDCDVAVTSMTCDGDDSMLGLSGRDVDVMTSDDVDTEVT